MVTAMKLNGKARSIPGGMLFAAFISILITFAFSAVIAGLLSTEKITWEEAGYWIMGMLYTASFIGCKCAAVLIKRQRAVVSMLSGLSYWGILLCFTALFFGGKFSAVWETAGIICAGCGSAVLLPTVNKKKYEKRIKGNYR